MKQVQELILIRTEIKVLQDKEKELMQSLLNSDEFNKEEVEGILVSKKTRATISLLPDIDLQKIKSLYPAICTTENRIDKNKLSDKVRSYLKEHTEAVEEDINVNARKLHEVTKEYTTQKLTSYIEVKGLK